LLLIGELVINELNHLKGPSALDGFYLLDKTAGAALSQDFAMLPVKALQAFIPAVAALIAAAPAAY
jgi:hypothetical protein